MGRYPRKNSDDYIRSDVASVTTAIGTVGVHHIEAPAAEGAAAVLALTSLPETATTTVTEGITQPDVPRNVSVVGNAAGITGNVVVHGTGMDFQPLSDTIALNATTKVYGTKAFRTVSSVVLPAQHAAGDKVSVGTGSALGLPWKLSANTHLMSFLGGARQNTGPTVVVTQGETATIKLASTLDGGDVDTLFII